MSECEHCDQPATTADDAGTPLCASCLVILEAEAEGNPIEPDPIYEQGYEDGFADAINDVVPDLLKAVHSVLVGRDAASFKALREAFRACKRVAA